MEGREDGRWLSSCLFCNEEVVLKTFPFGYLVCTQTDTSDLGSVRTRLGRFDFGWY